MHRDRYIGYRKMFRFRWCNIIYLLNFHWCDLPSFDGVYAGSYLIEVVVSHVIVHLFVVLQNGGLGVSVEYSAKAKRGFMALGVGQLSKYGREEKQHHQESRRKENKWPQKMLSSIFPFRISFCGQLLFAFYMACRNEWNIRSYPLVFNSAQIVEFLPRDHESRQVGRVDGQEDDGERGPNVGYKPTSS